MFSMQMQYSELQLDLVQKFGFIEFSFWTKNEEKLCSHLKGFVFHLDIPWILSSVLYFI